MPTADEIRQNAKRLEAAGAPPERIAEYVGLAVQEMNAKPSAPAPLAEPSFAGRAVSGIRAIGRPLTDLSYPMTNPVSERLRSTAETVNRAVETSADKAAYSGFPVTGLGISMINEPLTPETFSVALAGDIAPLTVGKLFSKKSARLQQLAADQYVGTPMESKLKSKRLGQKTLGEKFLDSELPSSREAAVEEASSQISDLESKIQAVLEKSASKSRVSKRDLPIPEFEAAKQNLAQPLELPSGQAPQRFKDVYPFGDREIGPHSVLAPDELNLKTPGKKFTKGESRGFVNPETPDIERKQIDYLKKERKTEILKAREAFKARMVDAEDGYALINRDTISESLDKIIKQAEKTGLEKSDLKMLFDLKNDFSKSHPQFADALYWNDIKRSIYGLVGDKGYLTQNPTRKVQALKQVARGIKKEIERVAPEIKDLNAQQGDLINIVEGLNKKINSLENLSVPEYLKRELKDSSLIAAIRKKRKNSVSKTRGGRELGLALPIAVQEYDE